MASRNKGRALPNLLSDLNIPIDPVPQTHNILALPHTNRTSAYFRPLCLIRMFRIQATIRFCRPATSVELVPDNSEDEVFPNTVGNTFL